MTVQDAEVPLSVTVGGPPPTARPQRLLRRPSFAAVAAVVTVLLVAIPLAILLWSSFSVSKLGLPFAADAHLSIANYQKVFTDGALLKPIANTVVFVIGSLAIG